MKHYLKVEFALASVGVATLVAGSMVAINNYVDMSPSTFMYSGLMLSSVSLGLLTYCRDNHQQITKEVQSTQRDVKSKPDEIDTPSM